ncbi:MAG TPA: response regulator [Solirubrobacteraceae bacterium]
MHLTADSARTSDRWNVLIVEDDLHLASIYARALTGMPRLHVAGVVTNGEQALAQAASSRPDLLILDLQLSGMDGVSVLRRLRGAGSAIEVIIVTAFRDADYVRATVHHGALDYIVKPFELERLRRAVGLFLSRMAALRAAELDQEAIDRVSGSFRPPGRWLPKGLTDDLLRRVRAELEDCELVSSADVAAQTGLARVTVRRYLEYLVSTNQAQVSSEPNGTGRPRKLYRLSELAAAEQPQPTRRT